MLLVHGFSPEVDAATRRRVVVVLIGSVLGISSSAVLVRGMEATPLAIAAWRTLGAAILLAPAALPGLRSVGRRDLVGIGCAGALLGAHFVVWFASLQATTVLRSTVLVALVPVWSAALEALRGHPLPPARFFAGVGLALVGVGGLAGGEGAGGSLRGDGLALLGGLLWAVYFAIGQDVRQRVELPTYMGLVCAAAAVGLWPVALLGGTPMGAFDARTWGLLLLAILGPQLLGHQGANYAVRYLPASVVATVMLLEPVGASLLAALVLGEWPGAAEALGGAIVFSGVLIAARAQQPHEQEEGL